MQYIVSKVALGTNIPISGLLLYGVPTNGSHLAQVARHGSKTLRFAGSAAGGAVGGPVGAAAGGILGWLASFFVSSHKQLEQLELGGKFVQNLNDEWAFRVANGGHPSEAADRRATIPVRVVFGNFDYIVPRFPAKSTYGAIDSHGLDFGHVDLVKPLGNKDERYLRAKSFLELCRPRTNRTALEGNTQGAPRLRLVGMQGEGECDDNGPGDSNNSKSTKKVHGGPFG